MTDWIERIVRGPGGRRIGVHERWPRSSSATVVLCHPAPGCGRFDPDPNETAASGIRLTGVDRPGYGRPDPVVGAEWATVACAADDIAYVLSDGAPVAVAGWSAGGRVALALAARHPSLVERVAVIATPAPHEEVPWVPEQQHAAMEALRGLPPETVHQRLAAQLQQLLVDPAVHLDQALALLGVSSADADALNRPHLRAEVAAMLEVLDGCGHLVVGPAWRTVLSFATGNDD